MQKAAIGFIPEVSEQLRVDDGADFGGFVRGISNRPLPEKITVAVDVDEGIRFVQFGFSVFVMDLNLMVVVFIVWFGFLPRALC